MQAVREGDVNTKFFHAQASARLRWNKIWLLEVDGDVVSSHHAKMCALTAHLKGLLAARPTLPTAIDVTTLYHGKPTVDANLLVAPFTAAEVGA